MRKWEERPSVPLPSLSHFLPPSLYHFQSLLPRPQLALNFCSNISPTTPGFAFPLLTFIT